MGNVVLYESKRDCCGCGACMNICSQAAIRMHPDENGFLYPAIQHSLCLECGACKKVCRFARPDGDAPPEVSYAAAARSEQILKKSSSGGVAAVLSQEVVRRGGVVYGAALLEEDGTLVPRHIRAENARELALLQGSKYVQSDLGYTYRQVRADLLEHRTVLFTGTPCQVAGLKAFLNEDYKGLYTAEIICHGVPNARFFQDFLAVYGQKLGGHITRFSFRDKRRGQGMETRASLADAAQRKRDAVKAGERLSYGYFFLRSHTYRESCYRCPYARKERIADVTLGDFWGFHEEYPGVKAKSGLSNEKGVSCVLVGSERGRQLLEQCQGQLCLMESDFEKISRHNEQLCRPSRSSPLRDRIFALYRSGGYPAVEHYFQRSFPLARIKSALSAILPKGLKRSLKRILGKGRGR